MQRKNIRRVAALLFVFVLVMSSVIPVFGMEMSGQMISSTEATVEASDEAEMTTQEEIEESEKSEEKESSEAEVTAKAETEESGEAEVTTKSETEESTKAESEAKAKSEESSEVRMSTKADADESEETESAGKARTEEGSEAGVTTKKETEESKAAETTMRAAEKPEETEAGTEFETEKETQSESEFETEAGIELETKSESQAPKTGFQRQKVASISETDGTNTVKTVDYRSVLGEAIQFGITANYIYRSAHMDTTVATKKLKFDGNVDITAGKYTNNNAGGSFIIADTEPGEKLSLNGNANVVYTTKKAAEKMALPNGGNFIYDTRENLEQQVADMIKAVQAVSKELGKQTCETLSQASQNSTETSQNPTISSDGKILDVSVCTANTVYINVDAGTMLSSNEFKVIKKPEQVIVFNFSATDVRLIRFSVEEKIGNSFKTHSSATQDASINDVAKTIILNMPNAKTVTIESAIFGVLLAPNAALTIGSTSSGWIVADTVKNSGGEWHFISQDVPLHKKVKVEAKKYVDDQTPKNSEIFSFTVEALIGDEWQTAETVQNNGDQILFERDYGHPGEHYYRISEVIPDDNYQYDTQKYIIKVAVTKQGTGNNTALQANVTYYKTGERSEISDSKKVNEIEFRNYTDSPQVVSEAVLPSTGGVGTSRMYRMGIVLIAAAFLLLAADRKQSQN